MKIVYSLSRNLYQFLLPSIMSLLDHNEVEKIYILALDKELPYELPEQCEVIEANPLEWFDPEGPNWRTQFTPMAMLRAATTKYIKDDKVIQLDVDTIVTDDLSGLWDIDLGTDYCAMVDEKLGQWKPFGEHYYNAGVMLLNLKQIREEKLDDRMIEELNTKQLRFLEQECWNYMAAGRIRELDVRYNECFATGQTEHPAIVHYAGYTHYLHGVPRGEYYDRDRQFEK